MFRGIGGGDCYLLLVSQTFLSVQLNTVLYSDCDFVSNVSLVDTDTVLTLAMSHDYAICYAHETDNIALLAN